MVDLMMWLVIAALLLAAAIQGIGYYQKATTLYTLKSDLDGAGSRVMGNATGYGEITEEAAAEGVAESKWSKDVTGSAETPTNGALPYLTATHPMITDVHAIYLFEACAPYDIGVNIVPKDDSEFLESCGVVPTPEDGGDAGAGTGEGDGGFVHTMEPVMVSTWDTSLPGCTTLTLPLKGTVDTTIDWGDGTTETVTTQNPSHEYTGTPGSIEIKIDGTFTGWMSSAYYGGDWTPNCITGVTTWGETETTSLQLGFAFSETITEIVEIPTTVNNTAAMLGFTTSFNGDVSNWDVSNVTTMQQMFSGATAFNQPLSSWDVSSVTNMNNMFEGATAFNQDLDWETTSLSGVASMFKNATSFNGDVSSWDTSNVTNMKNMFEGATAFNQDLNTWDTSNVTDMPYMFKGATSFNGDVSNWNTSNVEVIRSMFEGATSFNQDLIPNGSIWDTSNVLNFNYMFKNATSFNGDVTGWDTSSLTAAREMFNGATVFKQDLSNWIIDPDDNVTLDFAEGSAMPDEYLPFPV